MEPKNPYSELVMLIQDQGSKYNPPYICIGQVTNPPPKLRIKMGDLQLDSENLLMSDVLLDHDRQAILTTTEGYGETTEGVLQIESCLQKGALVALLPLEREQTYIVLSKVVSPNG
ncbi:MULTISPECIES: DUF2577 family protein [unclassified Dehalobacter]|uniref:DUF2577 family protein n=1 Tax=unclassified Dehalobacter TaxID=2635733 RepID=UPI000E6BC614|nr:MULTISPECIES: DUF2577 family protein [unclassified Dehalobacter]RJE48695.1 hypothetical protein A7K50_10215 [Dehalobacter sp. MCB1]TCX53389.1 hypothetical protein C1I36_01145 [Dehalobacter sp. 14DCB1]TCX54404.1 hypothetical protein C1I38_06530 [Dehalobacter sp. 12DCB1]